MPGGCVLDSRLPSAAAPVDRDQPRFAPWYPSGDLRVIPDRIVPDLERQLILARENPPMLWHVRHEGVLRHVAGSPAIMRAQLDKLAELVHDALIVS